MVAPKEHFYVVTGGRRSGIFTSWKRVLDATVGFPGAKFKQFSTLEEAKQVMEDNAVEPAQTPTGWSGPAYAVAVGRHMGVFRDHDEAKRQTFAYSGESWKKFDSYYQAAAFLDRHNWRKMPAGGDESEDEEASQSTDDVLVEEDKVITSEDENTQDGENAKVSAKRERDDDLAKATESSPPAQRQRIDNDTLVNATDFIVFCRGSNIRDSQGNEIVESSCHFVLHSEWDEFQTLHGRNSTKLRAQLMAVLAALTRAGEEDPSYTVKVTLLVEDLQVSEVLRNTFQGIKSTYEDKDVLQRIAKQKGKRFVTCTSAWNTMANE